MHCDSCGTDNKVERKFCLQCGAALASACAHCGFKNDPGDRFCGGCGNALGAVADKPDALPEHQTAGSALSQTVSKPNSGAERRQLTVMFCDLADSTAMSTRMDPEDLSRINRRYQETCTEVINHFDGYVARYMGDGILCYFGYPMAHENDAERAISAGLEIQRRIQVLNQSASDTEPIFVRVGIATGPVIVGEVVGSGASRESTAVGKTPNLASRLQSVASPGRVVIADETRALAGELFNYSELGELDLKGLNDRVLAWEVESAASSGSRFEAISSSELTPFVGRRHERVLLEDCMEDARHGRGKIIMLCGEPGIGKSRLIQVASEFDRSRTRILQCSPHHQSRSLHPFVEFLRAQQPQYEDATENWITRFLEHHGIQYEGAEGLLRRLLYGPSDTDPVLANAQLQKQQTLELVSRILTSSPDGEPWILVFEDLHWVDATTQELINNLVFSVSDKPVLMLLSFRPEYRQVWTDLSHVHLLSLNRINPEQCHHMIQSLMGPEISDQLARKIVDRTDGIPLFVEELARTILNSSNGSGSDEEIDIPGSLADSLNARLDGLGTARRSAQAAAIIGRSFGRSLLGAITRLEDDELSRQLDALVDSGLVYRLGEGTAASFQFKHALIQDAAYASLLRERRTRFHKRAAVYLEELYRQGHKLADLLSYHYIRAGLFDRGLHYARIAGETALSTSAVVEALDHFHNALEVIPKVRDMTGPRMRELDSAGLESVELQIQLGIAACFRFQDQYDDALFHLASAEALALELNDIDALSDLCNIRGNIYFAKGDVKGCLGEHGRSLEYAGQAGSLEKEARAIGGLGDAYYVRGEMKTATLKFMECCEFSLRHGFTTHYAANRAMIGWSRLYQLEISEACEDGIEGLRATRECGHLRGEMNTSALLGWVYSEMNEVELAKDHNENAMEIARNLGTLSFLAAVQSFDVRRRDVFSEREELHQTLTEAANVSRERGHGFHGPAILGALLLVTEDPDERSALVEEAEAILQEGSVGHNINWFYHDAIQAALNNREWDNLDRLRQGLKKNETENCKFNQFYIERSRILESIYRDQVTQSTIARRQQLIDFGIRQKMFKSIRELETAAI